MTLHSLIHIDHYIHFTEKAEPLIVLVARGERCREAARIIDVKVLLIPAGRQGRNRKRYALRLAILLSSTLKLQPLLVHREPQLHQPQTGFVTDTLGNTEH
jgi:hypothetical protein